MNLDDSEGMKDGKEPHITSMRQKSFKPVAVMAIQREYLERSEVWGGQCQDTTEVVVDENDDPVDMDGVQIVDLDRRLEEMK